MNACTATDCHNPIGKHGTKGYCPTHYKRYRKYGDGNVTVKAPHGSNPEMRLRRAGWVVNAAGCWDFTKRLDADGYGTITKDRQPYGAHRAAYETWVGPIPQGHLIRHTCDNRRCINPRHLLTGLPKDNSRDAQERERLANGERHGMHKLTDEDVDAMRREYAHGGLSQRALASRYGCSQAQVNNVLLRKQRANETRHLVA